MKGIERAWYTASVMSYLLWPLSLIFQVLSRLRKFLYRHHIFTSKRLSVPVIIVGNISVGGTGKTPFVIWLAMFLRNSGWRPGIISRGYGGTASQWPLFVTAQSDPHAVGDEPVLLAKRAACPVVVAAKRVLAGQTLLAETDCNIIISDDGLQHYALMRDVEIAVIDGTRRFGNGLCLPAGPLREPVSRLNSVDFVVCNGDAQINEVQMTLKPLQLLNVSDDQPVGDISRLQGLTIHAVAGIGNPQRFFTMLAHYGAHVIEHAFPDHHAFQPGDFRFDDTHPIVMTEKDAVKCRDYDLAQAWYVAIEAQLPEQFIESFNQRIAMLAK